MPSRNYTLVAWTENGQVRMVPSLINAAAQPYKNRIAHLESLYRKVKDEIGWLLTRSRAHEAFARFLLSVGHHREAFMEYSNAAIVCTLCSETLWIRGDRCDSPEMRLFSRFLDMHRECVLLAQKDRFLAITYEQSQLQKYFLYFTTNKQEARRELEEALEKIKAFEGRK